jgi:hypothetical protein
LRFPNARIAVFLSTTAVMAYVPAAVGQTSSNERVFPQPKSTVERALKDLQPLMAGQLPALEGFAVVADQPLNHYRRAYYQSTVQVTSTASGGTMVRVNAKVTAWYTDPTSSRSGYRLLPSNGRLEADLLDQLADRLDTQDAGVKASPPKAMPGAQAKIQSSDTQVNISAPMPRLPETGGTFSSSLEQSLAAHAGNDSLEKKSGDDSSLKAEAANLEEILKNQAHPTNLAAVKKSGTPVVATPSLNAKTLFLASAHDEFEILSFNSDWVHVRISGLSRGWIWRNNLEMPGDIPETQAQVAPAGVAPAAELFHVSREETAPFPGDWEPLRGKAVKIISVQKVDETAKDIAVSLRLEFAKSLLDKSYSDLAQKSSELTGIVLIFDSADGGMIAATLSSLQQWKAGKLSDAALWHQCFFDPPETLSSLGSTGRQ